MNVSGKTKQCKLTFPEDETTYSKIMEEQMNVKPDFQVSRRSHSVPLAVRKKN
jgi:hypothetical protein